MRTLAVIVLCACGGGASQGAMVVDETPPPRPITVEWKVEQGDGHTVNVALVVDGRSIAIGALDAATEDEAGTPSTCALRAAGPRRTEIMCGDASSFAADLVGPELLVTFVSGARRDEVKRIPVEGDALAVKMLALPLEGT